MKVGRFVYKVLIVAFFFVKPVSAIVTDASLEVFDKRHTEAYNNLHTAEVAAHRVQESGIFHQFLDEFAILLDSYELAEDVGLRLIHKHFTLPEESEQYVMSENFSMRAGSKVSITSVTSTKDDNSEQSFAASWMFAETEDSVLPFEFTSDSKVKEVRERIKASIGFFKSAKSLVSKYSYNSLIAVAVLKRDQLNLPEGFKLLEESFQDIGSVIRVVKSEHVGSSDMIQTSWDFSRNGQPRTVSCQPMTFCQDYGNIGGIDRHVRQSYHNK